MIRNFMKVMDLRTMSCTLDSDDNNGIWMGTRHG